jgi:glycosyltransferase involved in cell wall biosynthesis
MSPSGPDAPRTLFILPPREVFSPQAAGAIATVVRRLASATPGALVLGSPLRGADGFPGIAYRGIGGFVSLCRQIRRLNPAFIDIHQQPRLALALSFVMPRRKISLFLHNDPLAMRGLISPSARRLALARLHFVVCVSAYLASRYRSGLNRPGPEILPNPITLSELPAPVAEPAPRIIFAGRIVPDKAPDVFIAACALALPHLPGWHAQLIGGDRFGPASPETAYVARIRAAALAAGIGFAGVLPQAAVLEAMSAAAIVVVPSRWPEPFGLTALEAMACGAAVITTGQGGLPEVTGDAAIMVPPNDPPALAAAIVALAGDAPRRAALRTAGRLRAAQFDTPKIAAALENLRQSV